MIGGIGGSVASEAPLFPFFGAVISDDEFPRLLYGQEVVTGQSLADLGVVAGLCVVVGVVGKLSSARSRPGLRRFLTLEVINHARSPEDASVNPKL